MPEKEHWPAGPGSSSLDRMMSNASARSVSTDSSYDFLSAEEKACLRFLEETIGSLDTEADSGLSTDESEQVLVPRSPQGLPAPQPTPQGRPAEPAPHQGSLSRPLTPPSALRPPAPQGLGLRSGSHSLPRNIHIGRRQRLGTGTAQAPVLKPSEGPVQAPEEEQGARPREPSQSPARPPCAALALDTEFIPPPAAFRDSLPVGPRENSPTPRPPVALGAPERGQPAPEAMSQMAKEKGQPQLPGDVQKAPIPAGGRPEAQQGPLTAPKPRKLPPNIVLKSSRGSLHGDPQNRVSRPSDAPRDSGPAPSSLREQRRVRREALEKLGLPQDQEEPSIPPSNPKPSTSLKLKEPHAQALPVPLAPAHGLSPPRAQGPAPPQLRALAQEPTPGKLPATRSKPVPIPQALGASSVAPHPKPDLGLALQESGTPGLRQASFKASTLERSGVGLGSLLSVEKAPSAPTSTSLGKVSFLDKLSPQVLRNSRPRPASLGTGRDFSGIQVGRLADLEQEQSALHPAYHGQSRDKLPRPLCVSVKITPKGVPDEHRREALRKLGLLKE
ncbi:specifically androgen-regulated gene protein [Talpa occidentalis]|uniref:specifically androgen-regulated gene protein n=1 Tax=Talpa occidentalis TaxID=50954 RepID=UPI00188E0D5B|nr:specifically androgen-regulated gene protein [Talpa occidentalis]XP_054546084.1 specifically androgen-regulated gene protein [Talpa occidentalis]